METLLFAVRTTLPVFLLIMVGYGLKMIKVFPEESGKKATALCFRIFLPVSVAYSIYESNTNIADQLGLIAFMYAATLLIVVLMIIVVPRLVKDNRRRSVAIQGMFRSNALLLGVPLAYNIYGSAGTGPAVILIATGIPLMNGVAVMLFEVFREGATDVKGTMKRIGIGFITNPLIVAAFIGLLAVWTNITLPSMLETVVADIASIAIPLALLSLGVNFRFSKAARDIKALSIIALFKMIIFPGIILAVGVAVGFRGPQLLGLLAIFAMPCAVSGYVMAGEMGADGELAGELVVFTTIVASVTVLGLVYVLRLLGYL